jgi:hypothetical protein
MFLPLPYKNLHAMKSLFALCVLLFLSFAMSAQNCSGYYYLSSSEVQMTTYDKKGNESGKITYTISGVAKTNNTTSANFVSQMVDEKGKKLSSSAGIYKCSGDNLYIDARVSMPQEQMAAYKDMEVKANEAFIEYPAGVQSGQSLKDANVKMEVHNKGSIFSVLTLDATNRKVAGKESITTPAGTWECWKITYDGRFRATIGGPSGIGVPFNFKAIEWFAPGFGIVKTETFNKNEKLLGSTLITSVKK